MMLAVMNLLNRLERRVGWMAFPGFLRYYAILHVLVYMMQLVRPDIGVLLEFDYGRIMSGEVWRLVTFLFAPAGMQGLGPFALIFLFFMVMIAFMISDALEGVWGVFRTSMFYYTGIIGVLLANLLLPGSSGSGIWIYQASFLAFATLFPRIEFLMFFVIPVQVRFLAWFMLATMVFAVFGNFWMLPFFILVNVNYLLWAGIPALRGTAQVVKSAKRRRKFETNKQPDGLAFHTCKTCGRSDASDPELEFRVGADGEEYCNEHLPE